MEKARDDFGVEYPFAMQHTTYLFSDQKREGHGELIIRLEKEAETEKWVQLSGKSSGNLLFGPIVELYLDDLSFDEDGLADEYRAWGTGEDTIVMNPCRRFGEPIVMFCGYTAETLWEASIIEGGLDAAAKAYGVRHEDVVLACEYYDHLQSICA